MDPLPHRLAVVSPKMGATHTINPETCDLEAVVAEITGGEMIELAVEGRGPGVHVQPVAAICFARTGTLVYFGVPNKENAEGRMTLSFMNMFRKELQIVTSVGPNPSLDYTLALDWITQGRLDVRPILTHLMPFEKDPGSVRTGVRASGDGRRGKGCPGILMVTDSNRFAMSWVLVTLLLWPKPGHSEERPLMQITTTIDFGRDVGQNWGSPIRSSGQRGPRGNGGGLCRRI